MKTRPKFGKGDGPSSFEQLLALGPDVMSRVDSMLLEGKPASAVAHWIQDDLKKVTRVQHQSLKKTLERYRKKDLTPKTLARIAGATKGLATAVIIQRLNSLDELEGMVRHQKLRVEALLGRESQMPSGMLLKDTSNEIRLLKDMLVNLGDLQLETGILAKASKTVRGVMQGLDGHSRTFEWTEEQELLYRELAVLEEKANASRIS